MRRPISALFKAVDSAAASLPEEEWAAIGQTVGSIVMAGVATTLLVAGIQDSNFSPIQVSEIAGSSVGAVGLLAAARRNMSDVWAAQPVEVEAPVRPLRPAARPLREGIAALAGALWRPGFPPSTSGAAAAPARD